ncbi:hypothetical protein NMY22_g16600 [Coprinellus aureogranulatus]|nr:hypothetical protein NMY22_g16600 [Coprinellus aureogranulatus]
MRRNVVFFGETGVGKSSIINMIMESQVAGTSNDVKGCTGDATSYNGRINERSFRFWDTVGLNEGDKGKVPNMKAASSLYHLLRDLSKSGGVSLLVFCARAGRITEATDKNWILFRDIICGGHVPAVIVLPHLEQDEDMDRWWSRNEADFSKYNISPTTRTKRVFSDGGEAFHSDEGVACITAIKGKVPKGSTQLRTRRKKPYNVEAVAWFQDVVKKIDRFFLWNWIFGPKIVITRSEALKKIMETWGISEEDARKTARQLEELSVMKSKAPTTSKESKDVKKADGGAKDVRKAGGSEGANDAKKADGAVKDVKKVGGEAKGSQPEVKELNMQSKTSTEESDGWCIVM